MFNIGDKVKVFNKVGLQKEDQWNVAKVSSFDDATVTVHCYNNYYTVDRSKVKKLVKIGEKEINDFAEKNWEELKVTVSDAVANFFPKLVSELKFNEGDKTISVYDVDISPTSTERMSIGSIIETPTWCVTYWKSIAGDFYTPPDVDAVDCGNSPNNLSATRIFIDTIWRLDGDSYWESKAYDSCCKEENYDY